MDKREFLNRLQMQLADLTSDERREALEYYEEYFADAGEENEADVLISLGAPEQAAEQIKAGLHKADEGMFTENGYREKVGSDNPPDIYGRREESKESRAQDEAGQDGYAGKRGAYGQDGDTHQNGYAYQNGQSRDDAGGFCHSGGRQDQGGAGGWETYGRMPYGQDGYRNRQEEKKKSNMSGGTTALLVILGILASPVILALAAAAVGVIVGILGALFGVVAAILAVIVALFAAGIVLFIAGFPILFHNPFAGMACIALGCIMIALFLLFVIALVAVLGKFFPWLIREVESFGRYLSGKWAGRKRKGAEKA